MGDASLTLAAIVERGSSRDELCLSITFDTHSESSVTWREFVTSDPAILGGKPAVRGARLGVEFLLSLLAAGWTREQLLEGYPQLSEDGLRAVFAYAAEAVPGGRADDTDPYDIAREHDRYLADLEDQRATRDLKRDAHALIDSLPPNADWADLMYAVYVRQAVEAGERDIEAGRTLSQSELRARLSSR